MTVPHFSEVLQHRPSLHWLCFGPVLSAPMVIDDAVSVHPLGFLRFDREQMAMNKYANTAARGVIMPGTLLEQWHVSGLINFALSIHIKLTEEEIAQTTGPEQIEAIAHERLDWATHALSAMSGRELRPFGYVVATKEHTWLKDVYPVTTIPAAPETTKERLRREHLLKSFYVAASKDPKFAYGMARFHDAQRDANPQHRFARYFAILEPLAAAITPVIMNKKGESTAQTRKGVKRLLGQPGEFFVTELINGHKVEYDPVELAGRVRSALFHGGRFTKEHLNTASSHMYEFIADPRSCEQLCVRMRNYCIEEFYRWSWGKSRGQLPAPNERET